MAQPQPIRKSQGDSPENDAVVQSLYAKREKIYPREVHGFFARMRVLAVAVLLGLFYGVCWLQWEGQQLLVLDLPARRFHIFGFSFYPQDLIYLSLLLIIAAVSLFFFTALAGRLWCGYACPQTVWTELFMWIERKFEGDRRQQMKLDEAPWAGRKLALKTGKHFAWIALSLFTGFTFVGYFTPIRELWQELSTLTLGPWETFWVLFYGFATYGNAGWMREQVCLYMCPYARFQSAMFDKDTMIVSYDHARGEPRGARRHGIDPGQSGLGDCVNCKMCVQVCPTGIDIRDGLQYQCIACSACVDACDQVMDKMNYPKGLIRYTTDNAMNGKPTRLLRPRVLVYTSLLLVLVSGLVFGLSQRVPLVLDVIRDRNALYRETNEGLIENVYTLKIHNMDDREHRYTLSVTGVQGMQIADDQSAIEVGPGEIISHPVQLRADPYDLERVSSRIELRLAAEHDPAIEVAETARFLGPAPQR